MRQPGASPRTSVETLPSPRGPTAAHPEGPSPELPLSRPPRQVLIDLAGPPCLVAGHCRGSVQHMVMCRPSGDAGAQQGRVGTTQNPDTIPGAQHCPLPGCSRGDPSSGIRRQGRGCLVPPALGSTGGESQGWVGGGLSMGLILLF